MENSEQMTLDDFGIQTEKRKRLIQSLSLTWHRTICPYCKYDNPDSQENHQRFRGENMRLPYWDSPLDTCPNCGKKYDMDNLDVRMSKDYAECERLGLKGAVAKDEKGNWYEVRH